MHGVGEADRVAVHLTYLCFFGRDGRAFRLAERDLAGRDGQVNGTQADELAEHLPGHVRPAEQAGVRVDRDDVDEAVRQLCIGGEDQHLHLARVREHDGTCLDARDFIGGRAQGSCARRGGLVQGLSRDLVADAQGVRHSSGGGAQGEARLHAWNAHRAQAGPHVGDPSDALLQFGVRVRHRCAVVAHARDDEACVLVRARLDRRGRGALVRGTSFGV